MRIFTAQISKH